MTAELQAIQIHLWAITGFLALLVVAAGLCNYLRVKAQKETSPYEYMKYLTEVEQFEELREYATDYLKTRPNSADVLFHHSMAHFRLGDHDTARASAKKLAGSSPSWRQAALTLLEMIDEAASGS